MRVIARFHPNTDALRKKISGSIVGEAIQNDITGASGIPAMSIELMTGMTEHEQNGPNAPAAVARSTATTGRALNAPRSLSPNPDRRRMTANGMLRSRYGQMRSKACHMK
jgi:hypothetical protein